MLSSCFSALLHRLAIRNPRLGSSALWDYLQCSCLAGRSSEERILMTTTNKGKSTTWTEHRFANNLYLDNRIMKTKKDVIPNFRNGVSRNPHLVILGAGASCAAFLKRLVFLPPTTRSFAPWFMIFTQSTRDECVLWVLRESPLTAPQLSQ